MVGGPTTCSRRVLYGLGVILALSFLYLAGLTTDSRPYVSMYLPTLTGTMLLICWAGVEFRVSLDQALAERAQADQAARDRQHAFNQMWQALADHRESQTLPAVALQNLEGCSAPT